MCTAEVVNGKKKCRGVSHLGAPVLITGGSARRDPMNWPADLSSRQIKVRVARWEESDTEWKKQRDRTGRIRAAPGSSGGLLGSIHSLHVAGQAGLGICISNPLSTLTVLMRTTDLLQL